MNFLRDDIIFSSNGNRKLGELPQTKEVEKLLKDTVEKLGLGFFDIKTRNLGKDLVFSEAAVSIDVRQAIENLLKEALVPFELELLGRVAKAWRFLEELTTEKADTQLNFSNTSAFISGLESTRLFTGLTRQEILTKTKEIGYPYWTIDEKKQWEEWEFASVFDMGPARIREAQELFEEEKLNAIRTVWEVEQLIQEELTRTLEAVKKIMNSSS